MTDIALPVPEYMIEFIAGQQDVSRALLDANRGFFDEIRRRAALTPEERAREDAERAAARQARLEAERDVPRVALTLESLMASQGWDVKQATHYVQTYCECGDTSDGWDYCSHYAFDMARP